MAVAESSPAFFTALESSDTRVSLTENAQAGAQREGMARNATRVDCFGGPQIGASALLSAQTLALELPLHALIHEDAAGRVRLTHDDPVDVAARHGIDPADPGIQRMIAAFAALTAVAACES